MSSEVPEGERKKIQAGQTVRVILWLVVIGAVAVFALNTEDTEVDWAVGDGSAPLWLVIVASALAGFVAGLLASSRRRHH